MSTAQRLKEEPVPIPDPREAVLNKRPTSTGSATKRAKTSNGSNGSSRSNNGNGNGTGAPAGNGHSAATPAGQSGSAGNDVISSDSGGNGSSGNGSSSNGSGRSGSGRNGPGKSAPSRSKSAGANGHASNGSAQPAAPPVAPPAAPLIDDIEVGAPTVSMEAVTLYDVEREKPAKAKRSLRDFVTAKLLPAESKPTEPQPSDPPLFDEPALFEEPAVFDDVPGPRAPITGPVEVVPVAPPVGPPPSEPPVIDLPTARSPFVGLPVIEPNHGPPVGPPMPFDPGLLAGPGMLAPAIAPRVVPLPAVFDDDHSSSGLSFGDLFDPVDGVELDPELDLDDDRRPAAHAMRARTLQFAQRGRRGRPRVRRVTRVVRHVDPWSVFKVALCFSLVLYGVCLTAGVLLWNVAYTTGTIDNVQRFFESFGWDTFRFKGGELFHNAWIAGLFAALGLTGMIVLTATLFNLITDLVGGIRITVLEEEVVERAPVVKGPLLRRRKGLLVGPLLGPRPGQPAAAVPETEDSEDPFGFG
ncbi:MAG: hypothetical protein JWL72_1010 [Ilumatobacteraceae bacterium]|nr:hypothetical protein [Ilumatobacteraceae bacterium]